MILIIHCPLDQISNCNPIWFLWIKKNSTLLGVAKLEMTLVHTQLYIKKLI